MSEKKPMSFGKFISDKNRLGHYPNHNHPLNCYFGEPDWEDMFKWVEDYVDYRILSKKHKELLIDFYIYINYPNLLLL